MTMKTVTTLQPVFVPGGRYPSGSTLELEDHHADHLIREGYAMPSEPGTEPVPHQAKLQPETADLPTPQAETATRTEPARRKTPK